MIGALLFPKSDLLLRMFAKSWTMKLYIVSTRPVALIFSNSRTDLLRLKVPGKKNHVATSSLVR
jgi:hypothetical protein